MKVRFTDGKRVQVLSAQPGENLYRLLRRYGIALNGPCGGAGRCGACRIQLSGPASLPGAQEEKLLGARELAAGIRLACQAVPLGQVEIEARPLAGTTSKGSLTPLRLRKITPLLPPDLRRVGFETRPYPLGLALDLGTTTLACYLTDLADGTVLAEAYRRNPGFAYGEDVISRVGAVDQDAGLLSTMQGDLQRELNAAVESLVVQAGVTRELIGTAVVVGNSIMIHFFFGVDPSPLARSPFLLQIRGNSGGPARLAGLALHPQAWLATPPLTSAYIGSDALAGLLSALDLRTRRPFLLLDLGTNAEAILVTKDRILAASTAAGPAFEGYALSSGLPGGEGAISGVRYSVEEGLQLEPHDLGEARGITGSGVLDALAVLLVEGALQPSGRLLPPPGATSQPPAGSPPLAGSVVQGQDGWELQLAPGVQLTQRDIRQLQLAKAAIATATHFLLERAGIEAGQLKALLLAGAFGSYLRPQSAAEVGLAPYQATNLGHDPIAPTRAIGNAAGRGALLYLLSAHKRKLAKSLAQRIEVVNLAGHPDFQRTFLAEIAFPSPSVPTSSKS
ncbi:MAG: ASKHA domain-containing protein [Coprothermobacterota bacterium]|nr:ASKHA domain-containing protein [Coprothermobacterota bacterium]